MKKRIALVFICLNFPYWQYIKDSIEGARKYFLTDHNVDILLWTDMPEDITYGAKVFPTEPFQWPYPTLMRYHFFLQQEEELKKYDYIFYLDADMKFVDKIGDEILGDGLTAVEHPMYSFRPGLRFPLEPNPESSAYIPVPDHYFAGGFQGGTSKSFIKAMWTMKRSIDHDFSKNYIARWNDESHWNRYLFDNPPSVILDPSYCYPNSMIESYYEPIWGKKYLPKLCTVDKTFTFTKEAGEAGKKMTDDLQKLK